MGKKGEAREVEEEEVVSLTVSRCPHVVHIRTVTLKDVLIRKKKACEECEFTKKNRWMCLQEDCLNVGCGSKVQDHSTKHAKEQNHHVQLSLSNWRIYCVTCREEVIPNCNIPGWKLGETLFSGSSLERLKRGDSNANQDSMLARAVVSSKTLQCDQRATQAQSAARNQNLNYNKSSSTTSSSTKSTTVTNAANIDPNLIAVAPSEEDEERSDGNWSASSSPPTVHQTVASRSEVHTRLTEQSTTTITYALGTPMGRPYREHEFPTAVSDTDLDDMDDNNPRGLTGLSNLGNTCYMNSCLQALSNCHPLTQYFLSFRLAPKQPPGLSLTFKALLEQMWSSNKNGYVPPLKFLQQVRVAFPSFRGYGQQDSQEFLRYLLDQLHQELKEPFAVDLSKEGVEADEEEGKADSVSHRSSSSCSDSSSPPEDLYETADDSGCNSEQDHLAPRTRLRSGRDRWSSESRCGSYEDEGDERRSPDHSPRKHPPSPSTRHSNSTSSSTRKKPMRYRSIVTDIFDGKLASRVQCLTCNHVSETRETFQDLSLPIPSREQMERLPNRGLSSSASYPSSLDSGMYSSQDSISHSSSSPQIHPGEGGWFSWMWSGVRRIQGMLSSGYDWWCGPEISLKDCLAAFFLPDDLRGDDMYSCENCKKLRNGQKCCQLLSFPEVLCIHLKRFRHELMFSSKISTRVRFPLEDLDLRPFADKKCSGTLSRYELSAIICHYGGAEGGHYVAYCRNPMNNKWYEFDDTFVTEVSPANVLTSEAYVLFYQKMDGGIYKDRQEVKRKLENLNTRKGKHPVKFYISQEWLWKLNTFSEPGPITNSDFLCPHEGIDPRKVDNFSDRYAEIPDTVWKYLHSRFKGGPICSSLIHCLQCQQEVMRLRRKRETEWDRYRDLDKESSDPNRPRDPWDQRLITSRWLDQWDAFINGSPEIPGPIDNKPLLVEKHGRFYLRHSSQRHMISRDKWEYFYSIYGGGPEVYHTFAPQPTREEVEAEMEARAEQKRLREAEEDERQLRLAQRLLELQQALEEQQDDDESMGEGEEMAVEVGWSPDGAVTRSRSGGKSGVEAGVGGSGRQSEEDDSNMDTSF